MSYGTFLRLNDILGEAFSKHSELFNEVFTGLHNVSTLCEYVNDAEDIVQAFKDAQKAYAIALACQEMNEEFFTIMYRAAAAMENRTYADWFRSAIDKYFVIANDGDVNFEWALSMVKSMTNIAYDKLIKDTCKKLIYQGVAKLLNCTAGSVGIATFAYNTTYGLLDKVCKLNKKTTAYELMTYVAPVEKAMSELENSYAAILIGTQTLESAQDYDYFYNLYKNVNQYLYQAAYDYTSATFFKKNKADELEALTMCIDQWKRTSCHAGMSSITVKKFSSIHCPVDVYVYNADGDVLLEIINDEIVSCDDSITALTFDGKKSILYPADQNYTIRIVAREDGEMSYYVSEIQEDSSVRQVEFYDIPLAENQVFTGEIPESLDVEKSAYSLTTNEEKVVCNYDSAEQNSCADGHTVTTWTTSLEATCMEEGEQVGYCESCGKEVFEILPVSQTHNTTLVNASPATCIAEGYTGDQYCTVCKQTISTGSTISINSNNHVNTINVAAVPSTCTVKGYSAGVYCNDCKQYISGHEEQPLAAHQTVLQNEVPATCAEAGYTGDQYCTVCQQVITPGTVIDALGHDTPDANGDCPRCHEHIQDVEQPSDTTAPATEPETQPAESGGDSNVNFFLRILQWLIDFFAKLFGR